MLNENICKISIEEKSIKKEPYQNLNSYFDLMNDKEFITEDPKINSYSVKENVNEILEFQDSEMLEHVSLEPTLDEKSGLDCENLNVLMMDNNSLQLIKLSNSEISEMIKESISSSTSNERENSEHSASIEITKIRSQNSDSSAINTNDSCISSVSETKPESLSVFNKYNNSLSVKSLLNIISEISHQLFTIQQDLAEFKFKTKLFDRIENNHNEFEELMDDRMVPRSVTFMKNQDYMAKVAKLEEILIGDNDDRKNYPWFSYKLEKYESEINEKNDKITDLTNKLSLALNELEKLSNHLKGLELVKENNQAKNIDNLSIIEKLNTTQFLDTQSFFAEYSNESASTSNSVIIKQIEKFKNLQDVASLNQSTDSNEYTKMLEKYIQTLLIIIMDKNPELLEKI